MKNFLFKYRKVSLWNQLYIYGALLLFHYNLPFDAIVITIVGWTVGTVGEVEENI